MDVGLYPRESDCSSTGHLGTGRYLDDFAVNQELRYRLLAVSAGCAFLLKAKGSSTASD